MKPYDAYMSAQDRLSCPLAEAMAEAVAPAAARAPAAGMGGCRFPSLAMVYAPTQGFRDVYSPAEGLSRGTLFAGLDKPLEVGRR